MPDWLDALRHDLDAELDAHAPRVATLATVGRGGTAEARSVAVRSFDGGALAFTSDRRSEKNAELADNASATLVFWLAQARRQYRVAGRVAILPADDARTAEQWRAASDGGRSLFLWPHPGEPRDAAGAFPAAVSADVPVPASFSVLVLTPARVEVLDLRQTPHLRTRWTQDAGGWAAEVVNP